MAGLLGLSPGLLPQAASERRSTSGRQPTQCILAPLEAPSRVSVPTKWQQLDKTSRQGPARLTGSILSAFTGQTRAWAGHLWGLLPGWQEQAFDGAAANVDLLARTAERASEAEQQEKAQGKETEKPAAPDISRFLRPAGLMETRYVRLLSSLCAQTYVMKKLTPASLFRRHRLQLVTTSLACERLTLEVPKTAAQVFNEGDAMAVSPTALEAEQLQLVPSEVSPALESLTRLERIESHKRAKQLSPADLVASKLAAAASAAAAAARPFANNITSFTSTVPVHLVASQLQNAAAAGHSTAVATFATVSAAIESNFSRGDRSKVRKSMSPTEWYVCDDSVTHTRYFIIQGSDNFDHWKTNLTFDPVQFEDASLGVKVHRGVYEAALILYERFLPMVEEHVASSPFAKITFTGHSLGGSLATLLMLMYVRRGVLPAQCLSPVYTFGAPAIFCESCANGCCSPTSTTGCPLPSAGNQERQQEQQGVLRKLGLPEGVVRNVIMHKDIVPRAFACNYSLVADLLKRVGESFRDHGCLSGSKRVALYYAIGKTMVLQPDADMTFVSEGYHPMLGAQPGLFILQEPTALTPAAQAARQHSLTARTAAHSLPSVTTDPTEAQLAVAALAARPPQQQGAGVETVGAALSALMDFPHPLDILSEPGAYGPDGSISRYHNPDNYTKALGGVIRARPAWRALTNEPAAARHGSRFSYASAPEGAAGAKKVQPVQVLGPNVKSNTLPYVKHIGGQRNGGAGAGSRAGPLYDTYQKRKVLSHRS